MARPRVSAAIGDIRATAAACSAMLRVAATSQRHDQVTRRIHKLHAIQARVMVMSNVRAMVGAFASACERSDSTGHSGGASARRVISDNFVARLGTAGAAVATARGADWM